MTEEQKKQGKVTLSCRVLPQQKLELAERAEALGLSTCQYVEALVLKNHNSVVEQFKEDEKEETSRSEFYFEDIVYGKYIHIYSSLIEELLEQYPNHTEGELLTACVIHAKKNEKAWIQRSYEYFLNKLIDGKYDYLTPKNDEDDN